MGGRRGTRWPRASHRPVRPRFLPGGDAVEGHSMSGRPVVLGAGGLRIHTCPEPPVHHLFGPFLSHHHYRPLFGHGLFLSHHLTIPLFAHGVAYRSLPTVVTRCRASWSGWVRRWRRLSRTRRPWSSSWRLVLVSCVRGLSTDTGALSGGYLAAEQDKAAIVKQLELGVG